MSMGTVLRAARLRGRNPTGASAAATMVTAAGTSKAYGEPEGSHRDRGGHLEGYSEPEGQPPWPS